MAVRLILLALLACLTVRQQGIFVSNATLWTHAAAVTPTLARPAINLAVWFRTHGEPETAVRWLVTAGPLTVTDPRGAEYRRAIQAQLWTIEAFGLAVCHRPSVSPWCFS